MDTCLQKLLNPSELAVMAVILPSTMCVPHFLSSLTHTALTVQIKIGQKKKALLIQAETSSPTNVSCVV